MQLLSASDASNLCFVRGRGGLLKFANKSVRLTTCPDVLFAAGLTRSLYGVNTSLIISLNGGRSTGVFCALVNIGFTRPWTDNINPLGADPWASPMINLSSKYDTRYDTRCYFNVRSKADISQLNLPQNPKSAM